MKYEYQLLAIPVLGQDREVDVLNEYGEEGWMVVDVEHDYREGQRRYLLTRWVPSTVRSIDEDDVGDGVRRPVWARG